MILNCNSKILAVMENVLIYIWNIKILTCTKPKVFIIKLIMSRQIEFLNIGISKDSEVTTAFASRKHTMKVEEILSP